MQSLFPSYRGISVFTPLPFWGGDGGGANWLLVCEVTPNSLLMVGDGLLSLRRTYRGNLGDHSPLHSERGWG